MSSWFFSRAARRIFLGGVLSCFLSGSESTPCASSSTTVHITVDSAEAASTAVEAVSCTGGIFSVEWVGNIILPTVFNISGGTVLSVYGGGDTTGALGSEGNVIDGALGTQLFSISDAELNLEGVTITGGFAQPDDSNFNSETTFGGKIEGSPGGGAIFAAGSVVTMTDCVAAENSADNGGAVFLRQSHLEIFGVTSFTNNDADDNGGAIFAINNSTITVDGEANFFYNEGSRFLDGGSGGAIDMNTSSNLTIPGKATFQENSAGLGGALHWWINSFVNVTGEVDFSGNRAISGGAASWSSGEERVTYLNLGGRVTFFNNSANSAGAFFMSGGGDVSITGEVNFTENVADEEGGAIAMASTGTLSFAESAVVRFASNKGGASGGGIALWGSDGLGLRSGATVIFVGNSAGDSGGAIWASRVQTMHMGGSGGLLFVGNNATNSGGAVHVSIATRFSIGSGVEFRGNSARVGGAVVVESTSAGESSFEGGLNVDASEISECAFLSNAAQEDGGALYIGSGFVSVYDSAFEGNTAGRSAGALSILGVLTSLDNCTFHANSAPSGPAVLNIGTMRDQNPMDLEFESNSLACGDGQFVDYADPILSDDAAANVNVSAERYMVDCEGCPLWHLCTNCSLLGDVREPVCAGTPDHTTSLEALGTLETLKLDPGYWRATDTSKTILACYNEDACEGGTIVADYCSAGYEGPYCAVCEEGYAPGVAFSCSSCSDGRSLIATAVALSLVAVALVVAIILDLTAVVAVAASPTSRNGCGAGYRRLKAAIPFQSLKIVVVSWQIITQFSQMANAIYADSYERFLAIVGMSNLDLARFLAAGCLISTDFYDRLMISTMGPIAVLVVLACTYALAIWRNSDSGGGSRAVIIQKHASIALLVAFLIYGSVSATVFGTFACEDLEDGGLYLRVDYRIRCDTDKHRLFQVYAAFMIFLYPVGIPVMFAGLLYFHRGALMDRSSVRDGNPTIKPFADLWQPYRPEMYMFELLEYLRRILLTGIVVFIFPNTAAQIAVTFVMELFFFVVSVFLLPYAKRSDAWLSHVSHVVVMVSLYLALLLKVDVSDETDESQKVFAGVLVAVHCLMILSIIVEGALVMCEKAGKPMGTGGDDGGGSPTGELKYPLPKSSRYTGSECNGEDTAQEENLRWAETVEAPRAESQSQRQRGAQARPVSSMSPSQGTRSEKQPPPSFHERRPPAPPHTQGTGQEYPPPPKYDSLRISGGEDARRLRTIT